MTKLRYIFVMLALTFGAHHSAIAESVQPTAEQMRMIDQLPPAQHQQALNALRQMQSQSSDSTTQSSITVSPKAGARRRLISAGLG